MAAAAAAAAAQRGPLTSASLILNTGREMYTTWAPGADCKGNCEMAISAVILHSKVEHVLVGPDSGTIKPGPTQGRPRHSPSLLNPISGLVLPCLCVHNACNPSRAPDMSDLDSHNKGYCYNNLTFCAWMGQHCWKEWKQQALLVATKKQIVFIPKLAQERYCFYSIMMQPT
eukprot:669627-Rhodomonas_salina.1